MMLRWVSASMGAVLVMGHAHGQPAVTSGERLSQWMLKDRQSQKAAGQNYSSVTPYYLGSSWLSSTERASQEAQKQALIAALQKVNFPNTPAAQKQKAAMLELIQRMQATGRVPLPSTNPRFLEVSPKLDPILEQGDQVIVPPTPSSISIIRSNGSICSIRYRPNVEARFYIEGCKLRGKSAESVPSGADWAWIIEPDGMIKKVSIANWNGAAQDLPAPGSWIWAPPRWSQWTNANGDTFTDALIQMLAVQGPSGLANSMDAQSSMRGSLPSIAPGTLFSVARELPLSANVWGETGLLQTPSARTMPAGTGAITFGWFNPYANVNLFFSPLDELEFILRYTNMNNVVYGASGGSQTNKDKSVGLKLQVIKENYYLPSVAVGVRDAMGTGLFSGEYIVANKRHQNFDFSLGMGWGQLGTRNNITNPFVTAFGQNFATRNTSNSKQGGTPTGGFFHGTAALFGGVQYHTPWKNLVLKLEADGNNYQQLPYGETLPNKSVFNYGATYQTKNADFTVGVMGNSQVMFTISLRERLDLLSTPKLAQAKPVAVDLKAIGNYQPTSPALWIPTVASPISPQVLESAPAVAVITPTAINISGTSSSSNTKTSAPATDTNPTELPAANRLSAAPNSAALNKQTITTTYNPTLLDFETQTQWQVKGLQGSHTQWTVHLLDASGVFIRSRLNRGIAVLHRDAPAHIESFTIQFYNWGMLVSEFKVNRKQWMLENTQLLPPTQRVPSIVSESMASLPADGGNPFFRTSNSVGVARAEPMMVDTLKHKPLQTNIGISYAQVVGSPDDALLFSLGVRGDAIYKFRENTWLTGTVNARLIDNFGKYNYDPPPTGLQPVRTDIRQYMTQSIATMPNLQLTNTGKLANNHFVSAYAGYLEMMFAGAGGEYLWRPANSRIAVGADLNRVRQRQFNVWTSLQNYAVTTGHLTTYWDTGVQDILVKLSYGKYLAGDVGGTLDLSRVFQNGVKIGAYATRTNVDYAQFGEGSFDKGVYLSIPFDAFFAKHSDSSADLLYTPLIRDGGAKLFRKYQLYDMTRTRDPRALTIGPN